MDRVRQLPPLFWIGLLPVVMLLWLWADSLNYRIAWSCGGWELKHQVYLDNSAIRIYRSVGVEKITAKTLEGAIAARAKQSSGIGPVRRFYMDGYHSRTSWFPVPELADSRQYAPKIGVDFTTRLWVVPFWLILLGYAPLWLLLAWWQARRRRKKIERELAVMGAEA